MKAFPLITAVCISLLDCGGRATDGAPPAGAFDLQHWKLQIPGPREVKHLAGYSSRYFFLSKQREMCFKLDAAEQGPTPNTKYVRSELRHIPNWRVNESHSIAAEISVNSRLDPDKVTVLQIHGTTEDGGDAPPLLRIALKDGDLFAMLKRDAAGRRTDSILLKKGVLTNWFKVEIAVKDCQIQIAVDDQQKISRRIAYWKYPNYFKAGCYPQATRGATEIFFRKLDVK